MFNSVFAEGPGAALLPRPDESTVVIAPPAPGLGYWAGAPSAALGDDGIYLAYRLRRPIGAGRGYAIAVARSADGVHFETLTTIGRDEAGAESLERPGLVRDRSGRWRLYLSCATPGTKHWRIELLEAAHPAEFDVSQARGRAPRGCEDRRQGPGDQAERQLADVGVLPPAGRSRRGRPDGDRLRDQLRRARLDLARHRAERPARSLGRTGHPDQRGLAGRRVGGRVLRRAGQRGRELRGAHRHRRGQRARLAGGAGRGPGGRVALRRQGAALPRLP